MYKYILFDLDGTIADSGKGIINGVLYALEKFGIKETDQAVLNTFIGPPLVDAFMKNYSFSNERALKAVEYYREFYRREGIYQNSLYDGVKDLIKTLKQQGKTLVLATSKPQPFAEIVLKQYDLLKYFDFIIGATFDGSLNYKSDVIRVALQQSGINDKTKAIMIGDRHHDIEGAKENDLHSIGVLYGYGNLDEHENAGADYIAESPQDILRIINEN
ncbi:MAG: HAD family hydrolase [Clostridia bacterium]|nr:HAD family hydrolase [Clostridia bacterium]